MSEEMLIAGNGGHGSISFGSNCRRKECGRSMVVNGGNRTRFSMRCPCGLRLMVFVAADPNDPVLIWRDECPPSTNFNDYLQSHPKYREWKAFQERRPAMNAEYALPA